MTTHTLTLFGEEARAIADELGLEMHGDATDINTKLVVEYRSIEGHPKLLITFEI